MLATRHFTLPGLAAFEGIAFAALLGALMLPAAAAAAFVAASNGLSRS